MRKYLFAFSLFAFLSSCNHKPGGIGGLTASDSTFVISGTIAGLDSGKLIFGHRTGDEKVYDTVDIKKGNFQYSGKVPSADGISPYTCMLLGNEDSRLEVLVQNANIQINAKADSFANAAVSSVVS